MSKKFITFILSLIVINICYGQSGWVCKFFNNVNTFSKIIQIDNNNYIALCGSSKYFFRSTNGGNNWNSIVEYAFDSVYSLYDGQFLNTQTGWIVGSTPTIYRGVILKTTNGGINWFEQSTGFNNDHCYSLCFINENTGWVGSKGGTVGYLLKTTNGGNNWTKQDFPGAYQIRSVKFFDINAGWIVGLYNFVGRTTDGGQTWINKQSNITCTNFLNLHPISLNECWVLSNCVGQGMVFSHFFKTTNGGDNWSLMYSYTDSLTTNGHSFWKINFINSNMGFSNGDYNYIFRTTNAGLNWNRINVVSVPFTYPVISSLITINSNDIFACGGYSGLGSYAPVNYILKSTNAGINWNFKSYNYHYRFYDIDFKDQFSGLGICDTSIIFKTTDNGNNWEKVFNDRSFRIASISFFDDNIGNAFCYNGKILRTTNYGDNWYEINSPTTINLGISNFINTTSGFVIGDHTTLLKSTNSGSSWNQINLPLSDSFNCVNIHFINDNTGWLLNNRTWGWGYPLNIYYRNNKIIKTTDSGNNWFTIYDSTSSNYGGDNYHIVKFFDNIIGLMFLAPSFTPVTKIMKTTNGGVNWFTFQSNLAINVNKVEMINENIGWLGGTNLVNGRILGALYKTTNGGNNWLLQFNEGGKTIRDIYVLDSNRIWFCGDFSSIYYTTNGGGFIGIQTINTKISNNFILYQNYPNPFNPQTKIRFDVSANRTLSETKGLIVKLIIYDILGREVTTLVNKELKPGTYEADWDSSNYSSGVYFYKLVAGDYAETKKMVLIR